MSWVKSFQKEANTMQGDDFDTRNMASRLSAAGVDLDGIAAAMAGTEPPSNVTKLPTNEAKPVEVRPNTPSTSLAEGVDRIEAMWIEQLSIIKHNADVLERKIKACTTGLRQDMARLDLLGEQAMKEAERGRKVAQHFASSLDQIKSSR